MFWIMTLPSQITIFIAILIEWTNILLLIKKLLHFQWCVMCFRASDLKVSSWDSALVRRASTNTNEAGNHSLTLTRKHTTSPASSSCIYIHVRQWMCTRTLQEGLICGEVTLFIENIQFLIIPAALWAQVKLHDYFSEPFPWKEFKIWDHSMNLVS